MREELKFDSFIIGVQKAGTSYLKHLLSQHTEVLSHDTNEFSYYHDPFYKGKEGLKAFMLEHFDKEKVNEKKHVLGKNVGVFNSSTAIERLKKDIPDVKIIVVLREPISRVFSAYNYCYSRGIEKNKDFSKAIRETKRYPNDSFRARNCNYTDTSMYTKYLDRIYSLFSPDNILLINYDDLKEKPQEVCSKVFKFMCLEEYSVSVKANVVVNKGVEAKLPVINRLFLIKDTFANRLWKKLPSRFRHKVFQSVIKLNSKNSIVKKEMSEQDRIYLKNLFQKELVDLEKKYGIKFTY